MIVDNHFIAHQNVASKYYRFTPEEIGFAVKDFQETLNQYDFHADGRMFFSILSDPTSEFMDAEIFLSISEDRFEIPEKEQINFRSYFFIKPMIMTRIIDDFNEQSQVKYWELVRYMEQNRMKQKTPVFVEFKTSLSGRSYVEMSVGV